MGVIDVIKGRSRLLLAGAALTTLVSVLNLAAFSMQHWLVRDDEIYSFQTEQTTSRMGLWRFCSSVRPHDSSEVTTTCGLISSVCTLDVIDTSIPLTGECGNFLKTRALAVISVITSAVSTVLFLRICLSAEKRGERAVIYGALLNLFTAVLIMTEMILWIPVRKRPLGNWRLTYGSSFWMIVCLWPLLLIASVLAVLGRASENEDGQTTIKGLDVLRGAWAALRSRSRRLLFAGLVSVLVFSFAVFALAQPNWTRNELAFNDEGWHYTSVANVGLWEACFHTDYGGGMTYPKWCLAISPSGCQMDTLYDGKATVPNCGHIQATRVFAFLAAIAATASMVLYLWICFSAARRGERSVKAAVASSLATALCLMIAMASWVTVHQTRAFPMENDANYYANGWWLTAVSWPLLLVTSLLAWTARSSEVVDASYVNIGDAEAGPTHA